MISIIVPVYNVQDYLPRCIESLLNQTYYDIEIILINDGSTDFSGDICNDYAHLDSRVKVIHKSNGGLSDARNTGVKLATREYIMFVDSDDFIKDDACQLMVKKLKKVKMIDVLTANYEEINKDTETNVEFAPMGSEPVSGKKFLKYQLQSESFSSIAWRNLYHRDFLIANKLYFIKGLLHEDVEWFPRVVLKANNILVSNITFYQYLIREDSITTQKNQVRNAEHLLKSCYKLLELKKIYINNDAELEILFNEHIMRVYLQAFDRGKLYNKKELLNNQFMSLPINNTKLKFLIKLYNINTRLFYIIRRGLNLISRK